MISFSMRFTCFAHESQMLFYLPIVKPIIIVHYYYEIQ
jgi:hypothetical protein